MPRRTGRPESHKAIQRRLAENRVTRATEEVVRHLQRIYPKGIPPRILKSNIKFELKGRDRALQLRQREREDRKLDRTPEHLHDKQPRILLSGYARTEGEYRKHRRALVGTKAQRTAATQKQSDILTRRIQTEKSVYRNTRRPELGYVSYEEVHSAPVNRQILQDALGRKKTTRKRARKK